MRWHASPREALAQPSTHSVELQQAAQHLKQLQLLWAPS
jgi:hypothetical protein